ncbi:MAG: hypothetical protein IJH92_06885 [Mogibacterium sp.]|nr:hypothetical protein [Mogibacterium sp.]
MKKRLVLIISLIMVLLLVFTGCGGSGQSAETEDQAADVTEETAAEEESANDLEGNMYGYSGTDPMELAAYKYMADVVAKNFDEADASIPVITIIEEDEANPDDVLVKGDFWIDNYNIEGDTLMSTSGGNYPGCMHMKKNDDGSYEVTSFDVVADGGGFTESAKEIFGDKYDDFIAVQSDSDAREAKRLETVTVYVNANEIPCTQYQDEGWDPVKLHL